MSRKLAPGEGKTFPLGMRTSRDIRQKVETAARAANRSLAKEAELRLSRSFEAPDTHSLLVEQIVEQIVEQMAAIIDGAVKRGLERAAEKAMIACPEPLSSPPPVYRQ